MRYSYDYMQFIQASYQEIDKIIELAQKIWRDHYPSIIGEEQVEFMSKYKKIPRVEMMQKQLSYLLKYCHNMKH